MAKKATRYLSRFAHMILFENWQKTASEPFNLDMEGFRAISFLVGVLILPENGYPNRTIYDVSLERLHYALEERAKISPAFPSRHLWRGNSSSSARHLVGAIQFNRVVWLYFMVVTVRLLPSQIGGLDFVHSAERRSDCNIQVLDHSAVESLNL